jgi:hypothetical protein
VIYESVMGRDSNLNFSDPGARFTVRVYDGFDRCWCDIPGAVGVDAAKALEVWCENTGDGTHHRSFQDIDYYRIFPANSRMLFDGQ